MVKIRYPRPAYSITSSARSSSEAGTVRPSVFAVLRLITSWYFVGACTGRLAGLSPLRMRSTLPPDYEQMLKARIVADVKAFPDWFVLT